MAKNGFPFKRGVRMKKDDITTTYFDPQTEKDPEAKVKLLEKLSDTFFTKANGLENWRCEVIEWIDKNCMGCKIGANKIHRNIKPK